MEEEIPSTEPSLEPPGDAVKEAKVKPFARVFEGWELGAITVGLVLSAALLAVPRRAAPGVFPVPLVDVAEANATRRTFAQLADRAEREGLPFETRAVGDAVRRLGTALASGVGDPEHLNRLMSERVQAAMAAQQVEALLRLRAVQARLFVRAVREHAWSGPASAELQALGGDFVARAVRNGWAGPGGCVASDDELTTLFARRWVEVTRLRDEPHFKATLGEQRRFFRFLLLHPERAGLAEAAPGERAQVRLRYVDALARHDTEYPLGLARGSLFAQLGRSQESAQALAAHLARPSSLEWNLRARNYLRFAAAERGNDPGDAPPLDEP